MSQSSMMNDPHVDVADHPVVWRWLKETARKEPAAFVRLTQDNSEAFTILFGPAKYESKGEKGWKKGWVFVQFGLSWLITTGQQGTIYRIKTVGDGDEYLKDPKVSTGSIHFFQSLQKQIIDL